MAAEHNCRDSCFFFSGGCDPSQVIQDQESLSCMNQQRRPPLGQVQDCYLLFMHRRLHVHDHGFSGDGQQGFRDHGSVVSRRMVPDDHLHLHTLHENQRGNTVARSCMNSSARYHSPSAGFPWPSSRSPPATQLLDFPAAGREEPADDSRRRTTLKRTHDPSPAYQDSSPRLMAFPPARSASLQPLHDDFPVPGILVSDDSQRRTLMQYHSYSSPADDYPSPRSVTTSLQALDQAAARKWERWTDDDHRLFLIGLEIHEKGQWKNISKEIFSGRKTEAQITSHAQKYFLRQAELQVPGGRDRDGSGGGKKRKKCRRIHDINTVNDEELEGLVSKNLISDVLVQRLRASRAGRQEEEELAPCQLVEQDTPPPDIGVLEAMSTAQFQAYLMQTFY
ncbi:hypothetical protein Dimus_031373 [Dionaea muscipula]